MADHNFGSFGIKEETERTFLTHAEMLAAAREEGRREGLKEAAEIARAFKTGMGLSVATAIEARLSTPTEEPADES